VRNAKVKLRRKILNVYLLATDFDIDPNTMLIMISP